MKALLLILTVQFLTLSAFAVQIPGWDRPLAQATQVTILKATGELAQVQDITLLLTNNVDSGIQKIILNLDNESYDLTVQQTTLSGCHSQVSHASDLALGFENTLEVEMSDHATRVCKDLKRYQWELSVTLINVETQKTIGTLKLGANPQAIYTIQNIDTDDASLTIKEPSEDKKLGLYQITI